MLKPLIVAFLLAGAAPAFADCLDFSPMDFAVQFKMHDILGDPISGLDEFSMKELGDHHWKARQIAKWTDDLAPGCVKEAYRRWVLFYLRNYEEETDRRRHPHAVVPDNDPAHGREQDQARDLMDKIPTPK
jgi:hypothetical protein